MDWNTITNLMKCFPHSIINQNGEFIAHIRTNQYFILRDCKTELDIKCKVLEWLSRGASKAIPYSTKKKNDEFNKFMRDGINRYLGTDFSAEEMEEIYTYIGNCCHHQRTIRFIESGYDMDVLQEVK